MSSVDEASIPNNTTYILITQCLQNGFFLDDASRLALPLGEVVRMLVGSPLDLDPELNDQGDISLLFQALGFLKDENERQRYLDYLRKTYLTMPNPTTGEAGESVAPLTKSQRIQFAYRYLVSYFEYRQLENKKNRREIPSKLLKQGPLYQFLKAVIEDDRTKNSRLHVLNVRDWHEPSDSFDQERMRYGIHCKANTWGAEPIDGYEAYLEPWKTPEQATEARSAKGFTPDKSFVTYYDIRSNSLFDFKDNSNHLETILNKLIRDNPSQRIYVVVIGIYTDIKIKLLLSSLRERYEIRNLIVSDILTAAPSLERHLSGLDFAQKVLGVEVTHSLEELTQVLVDGDSPNSIPQAVTVNSSSFRDYQTYFLDKQNLLAYQEQKQIEYLELTKRRAMRLYKIILWTSRALIVFGITFVILSVVAVILAMLYPDRATSDYLMGTGILGLAGLSQIVIIFLTNPINYLQKNLNHLVRLQSGVESQSLMMALMRYHFSRPERLYPQDPHMEEMELKNVRTQLEMVQTFSKDTLDLLRQAQGESDDTLGNASG